MAELSPGERKVRLGYAPGPGEEILEQRAQRALASLTAPRLVRTGFAPSYDLRNVGGANFITPVRDQGGCGSCVAFGTAAAVEGTLRVTRRDPSLDVNLSEAHLFYCYAREQGRSCATGWWPSAALDAMKAGGVVDEACFPYTAGDQPCNLCPDWENHLTKISGWHTISDPLAMKAWIAAHGPLVTCFAVYSDFFHYVSGVYRHQAGDLEGGHCVCVVGYDDAQGCWICKNSWGTRWGENGFFRIAYGDCGIDSTMWTVDGFPSLADTQLEVLMDDFVSKVVGLEWEVWRQDPNTRNWARFSGTLVPSVKYRLQMRARNNGSETYVRNVNIRVQNPSPELLTFFSDETYQQPVTRKDSPIYPETLNPPGNIGIGRCTAPDHIVYFTVNRPILPLGWFGLRALAAVGIYAEIVPQGHGWMTVVARFGMR